jgi:hypothetical protein
MKPLTISDKATMILALHDEIRRSEGQRLHERDDLGSGRLLRLDSALQPHPQRGGLGSVFGCFLELGQLLFETLGVRGSLAPEHDAAVVAALYYCLRRLEPLKNGHASASRTRPNSASDRHSMFSSIG